MLERLPGRELLHLQAPGDLASAQAFLGEGLCGADTSHVRGETDREQERLLSLEGELAGLEERGQVALLPRRR